MYVCMFYMYVYVCIHMYVGRYVYMCMYIVYYTVNSYYLEMLDWGNYEQLQFIFLVF